MKPDHLGIGMTSQRTRERLVRRLAEQGIRSEAVLEVIRTTPRHLFVDEALAGRAYEDTALPIGFGQTISQPYVVARMTEALLSGGVPGDVLEIGTGSGYQTAILARLVPRVYTLERIAGLIQRAQNIVAELDLDNVLFRHSDGEMGWPAKPCFDGIIVTAAPEEVPQTLMAQLAPGGRMVIPVGQPGRQELRLITRTPAGYQDITLDRVSFVPLLRGIL
ncbi:MAG: protein-L-isoaspartate(D-aspartate) O-methyltransferase [Chromatiales bacterium]|nr:protein-L-isoaspartate(D-aspartate) O-methyltransferase [Chromatiales bacterium]